jgi:hypothetical protein
MAKNPSIEIRWTHDPYQLLRRRDAPMEEAAPAAVPPAGADRESSRREGGSRHLRLVRDDER